MFLEVVKYLDQLSVRISSASTSLVWRSGESDHTYPGIHTFTLGVLDENLHGMHNKIDKTIYKIKVNLNEDGFYLNTTQ